MSLNGHQVKALREALQAAILRDDLKRFIREELDLKPGNIIKLGTTDENAFSDLIEYVESQNLLSRLLLAVSRCKHNSREIQEFAQDWVRQEHKRIDGENDSDKITQLLRGSNLVDELKSMTAGSWPECCETDIKYLEDSQCSLIYAQVLLIHLSIDFPEHMSNCLKPRESKLESRVVHLMFVINECGATGKQLNISSILRLSKDKSISLPSAKIQGRGVRRNKDIAQQIQRFMEAAEKILDRDYQFAGEVAVHFFVSLKELGNEWDQLKCLEGGRVINTSHPVLVRAKERYELSRYRRELRKVWQGIINGKSSKLSRCINCDENVPSNVIGILWKGKFQGKRQSKKAFEQILHNGIPMATWLRCTDDEQAGVHQQLERLLSVQAIQAPDDWFQEVQDIRKNSGILERHLAIWWDDPELSPALVGFGEEAGESA